MYLLRSRFCLYFWVGLRGDAQESPLFCVNSMVDYPIETEVPLPFIATGDTLKDGTSFSYIRYDVSFDDNHVHVRTPID